MKAKTGCTLEQALRAQLETPETTLIGTVQQILFSEMGVDVRRSEIVEFFKGLFPIPVRPAKHSVPSVSIPVTEPPSETVGQEYGFDQILDNPGYLLTGRKLASLRLPDGSRTAVKSWRHLAQQVLQWMAAHKERPALPFRARPYGSTYFLNIEPRHEQHPMNISFKVNWDGSAVYAEVHQSAKDLISALCKVADPLGLPATEFHVTYGDGYGEVGSNGEQAHNLGLEIVAVLRRLSVPTHYQRIAEELNRQDRRASVSVQTVRATLGDYKDLFANLGQCVYALKEWGVNDQQNQRREGDAIPTIILKILEQRDEPMDFEAIVRQVKAVKSCREGSVRGCLARDERFHVFGSGKYGLKQWVI